MLDLVLILRLSWYARGTAFDIVFLIITRGFFVRRLSASFLSVALVTAVSAIAFSQIASAADLPTKARASAPINVPLAYNWTGFYVGGNVGYSWGKAASSNSVDGVSTPSETVNPNGFIGGGQLGFNWQTGSWVFGVETDFQGSAQKTDTAFLSCPATLAVCDPVGNTTSHTTKLDWFGTTRGRIGYAAGNGMLYGT